MCGKPSDHRDFRIDDDLRIFQPGNRAHVSQNSPLIVDPHEHDCELDEFVIFDIQASAFDIQNRDAATVGRDPIFGHVSIRTRHGAQHAVALLLLEKLGEHVGFGFMHFLSHISVSLSGNRRGVPSGFALHSFFLSSAGSTGNSLQTPSFCWTAQCTALFPTWIHVKPNAAVGRVQDIYILPGSCFIRR
ncbi:MAG: hypothetical protein ABJG07_06005 [Qipengyuania citrea]|uniref:hypothetical protein n=1 Tax=Qipengyuania citrea TaxID=225971 RepID=UPI003264FB79